MIHHSEKKRLIPTTTVTPHVCRGKVGPMHHPVPRTQSLPTTLGHEMVYRVAPKLTTIHTRVFQHDQYKLVTRPAAQPLVHAVPEMGQHACSTAHRPTAQIR